jgi:starvation-inducible outer membrane lipoprotein
VKKNLLMVIAVTLTLAACASAPKPDVVQKRAESAEVKSKKQTQVAKIDMSEKVCEYTRATGTMLKTKRCRTRAQIEADRETTKDTMKAIHTSDVSLRETRR